MTKKLKLIGLVITLLLLISTVIISYFLFSLNKWLLKANGYIYEDIYTEVSPDGHYEVIIQKTKILEGISNESYLCKITLLDDRKHMVAEYEGGIKDLSIQDILEVQWDNEHQKVTVILNSYNEKKQEIILDYSLSSETKPPNYSENLSSIIIGIIVSDILFIVSISCTITFIKFLYCSKCRKKYIEQLQTENGETTDSENKT